MATLHQLLPFWGAHMSRMWPYNGDRLSPAVIAARITTRHSKINHDWTASVSDVPTKLMGFPSEHDLNVELGGVSMNCPEYTIY